MEFTNRLTGPVNLHTREMEDLERDFQANLACGRIARHGFETIASGFSLQEQTKRNIPLAYRLISARIASAVKECVRLAQTPATLLGFLESITQRAGSRMTPELEARRQKLYDDLQDLSAQVKLRGRAPFIHHIDFLHERVGTFAAATRRAFLTEIECPEDPV